MLFCFANFFVGFNWVKLSAKTRSFAFALRDFCAPTRAQHFEITLARAHERVHSSTLVKPNLLTVK